MLLLARSLPPPSVLLREQGNLSRLMGSGCPTPGLLIACFPLLLLQLYYQHQVVQDLHRLWYQDVIPPPKAKGARPGEEERLSPWAQAATAQPASLEKTPMNTESLAYFRSPVVEPQLSRQERLTLRDSQDSFRSKKTGVGVRSSGGKSLMEEILVEGSPELESAKSPWELEGLPLPKWNLCLEDFRKVLL